MAYIFIDRRKNDKGKSTDNRRRFTERVRGQIKEGIKKIIRDSNIKDVTGGGKDVYIPGKGLDEPTFDHDQGGIRDVVLPGNDKFEQGDRIPRPEGGGSGGGGSQGSQDGEGEDAFRFKLSREEFLKYFFEDLELPDMVKKTISTIDEYAFQRAGFTTDGNPSRLDILRSMRKAKGRHQALKAGKKAKLRKLREELEELNAIILSKKGKGEDTLIEDTRKEQVEKEIEILKRRIGAIPFIDDIDLMFRNWEKHPTPTTKAVMFCIMDVSGSMSEWHKEMSKRFFMLLYLFLIRNYERVDIIFIRHHSSAKVVDEEEFFYSRETGGTVVSTAFELMLKVIQEDYPPSQWNIFACQASDGDNWYGDSEKVKDILLNKILPIVQYLAYVEIKQDKGRPSDLWAHYEEVREKSKRLAMSEITNANEIYPVFRGLFEKRT